MYRENKPEAIIIHHTATDRDYTTFASFQKLEAINAAHKKRWPYFISQLDYHIGYHYFIEGDGTTWAGRKEEEGGAHILTPGWNEKSIAICLAGNFMVEYPSDKQLESLENLMEGVRKRWNIPRDMVFAHRQKQPTLCPGTHLFEWVKDYQNQDPLKEKKIKLMQQICELLSKMIELLQQLKLKSVLGSINNLTKKMSDIQSKQSLTIVGIVIMAIGFALEKIGVPIAEGNLEITIVTLMEIFGGVVAFIGRYRQGDINLFGRKISV